MPMLHQGQNMAHQGKNDHFFADMPACEAFRDITDLDAYQPLPDDWTVLTADVVGSTKAIERGAYKSVNMVGAASIICVLNASEGASLPFQFGGDGGLIVVPPPLKDAAVAELKRLQSTSESMFGLSLRAAAIPVGALRDAGSDMLVRKYQLSPGNNLAMFAGGGPGMADVWLKAPPEGVDYAFAPDGSEPAPDLEGLSCRWEPLKSRNGVMLTVIMQATDNPSGAADALATVLGARVAAFAPAHDDTMRFRWPPRGLRLEIKAGLKQGRKLRRACWAHFTSMMQLICEKRGVKIGDYDGATYREELKAQTDYRKFDGALRMVLDLSLSQADAIEGWLADEYAAGRLKYGTHRSDSALMTCLLFNLAESQHIHFIDGSNGGYAMAAKAMKSRA
ncbi:MAG: DUF3095 domain-containing protein [Pikeienuella sp.]